MVRSIVAWFFASACFSGAPGDLPARERALAVSQMAAVSLPAKKDDAVLAIERALRSPASVAADLVPTAFQPAPKVKRPKDAYEALRFDLDQERKALAWRAAHGEDVEADARNVLASGIPDLIEKWKGTRWSYSGTTTVPKKGAIACGYFVSTVLLHAGLDLDRVDLSRQASEQIIRTLVPDDRIERFHKASRDTVVNRVERLGEGVYIAGLDTHIGFLVNEEGKPVQFCHSTERNRRQGVICELARESPSFKSRYTVLGRLGEGPLLDAWLAGDELPTARKFQAQAPVLTARAKAPVAVAGEEPLPDFEWFYEDWASIAI